MFNTLKQMVDGLTQDIKFAARGLRKSPAFTAVAVVTLGLGIGANSAVFTVVDAVLLKGLPYRQSDRLVHIWETSPSSQTRQVSYPDFQDVVTGSKTLESVAGYAYDAFTLSGKDGSERLGAGRVSANFFSVLGVEPILGRTFRAEEDQPLLKRDVAIISYGLWQRRFGGAASVIGQRVTLNDAPFTLIGVLPREFHFARLGQPDVFVTMSPTKNQVERRYMHWMWALGRMRDGVGASDANAEMASLARVRAQADTQWHKDSGLRVAPIREALVGPVGPLVLGLFGAVAAVLLIACANVANMLLARAMGRQREVGIRLAMGAGRWRLARQFLVESVLLSLMGGALGLLWAGWGVRSMMAAIPAQQLAGLPFLKDLRVDPGVLAFTFAVCVVTGLLFGLMPAFRTSSGRVTESLKEGARGTSGKQRLRSALVVSEIAIALSLVAATGLFTRSLSRLLDVNPGFETKNLLTARISVPSGRYDTPEKLTAFFDQWQARIAALPGVQSVALVNQLPLLGSGNNGTPSIKPGVPAEAHAPDAELRTISENYFKVMGLPIRDGRAFAASDRAGATPVVVINQAFVDEIYQGEQPLGKKVTFPFVDGPLEVVGVVGNEKAGALDGRVRPVLYFPFRQDTGASSSVVIRTSSDPSAIARALSSESRAMEPDAIVSVVRTMDEVIAGVPATFLRRYPLLLLGCFAVLALVLASIGIYGVMSLSVTERTSEIGIRMALGAQPGGVLQLILKQGMTLAAMGVSLGIAMALAGSRVLASALFETPATDPLVFASAAAVLTSVAALACLIPAHRASRVDPLHAVRHE
ncbi:MAG: ABC transporter permease [Vicinamibacteria bacterium]